MPNDVQIASSLENIQGGGSVAAMLLANSFNLNCLRPFIGEDGKNYINNAKGTDVIPVQNAVLRKDEWIMLDSAVTQTAKSQLRIVNDLLGHGLRFALPGAMGIMTLQYQNQSDVGSASVSLDGLAKGRADRPEFDLNGIPLPIVHADFGFSAREIEVSRRMGIPIDTATAEGHTRSVAEKIENIFWGKAGTISYGGNILYGIENFPSVVTGVLTSWAAEGKTQAQRLTDVLTMKAGLKAVYQRGPYLLFIPTAWESYLDQDMSSTYPNVTLRDRIAKIADVTLATSDFMTATKLVMIQLANETIQVVDGVPPTLVQWPSEGGMALNYKIISIMVPRIRADFNARCGIYIYAVA